MAWRRHEPDELGRERRKAGGRHAATVQTGKRVLLIVDRPDIWTTIRGFAIENGVTLSSYVEAVLKDHAEWVTYKFAKARGGVTTAKAGRLRLGIYSAAIRGVDVEGGFTPRRPKVRKAVEPDDQDTDTDQDDIEVED